MLLKHVNDSCRSIYAFEMLPPPAVDAVDNSEGHEAASENCIVANNTVNVAPKSAETTHVLHSCDIVNDLVAAAADAGRKVDDDGGDFSEAGDRLNNRMESSTLSALVGDSSLCLESNPDVNWQHNQLSDLPPSDANEDDDSAFRPPPEKVGGGGSGDPTPEPADGGAPDLEVLAAPNVDAASAAEGCGPAEAGGGDAETGNVADEWKSCAICLEDKEDEQLLVHGDCGGTFCPSCLTVLSTVQRGI